MSVQRQNQSMHLDWHPVSCKLDALNNKDLFSSLQLNYNTHTIYVLLSGECNALRAPYFTAKSACSSDFIGLAARKHDYHPSYKNTKVCMVWPCNIML